jgi:hypothetical protein
VAAYPTDPVTFMVSDGAPGNAAELAC